MNIRSEFRTSKNLEMCLDAGKSNFCVFEVGSTKNKMLGTVFTGVVHLLQSTYQSYQS